ncbi:Respiratory supercomplex factor 1, mitochondrial [Oleoguttula sp. CCFEE 5521]
MSVPGNINTAPPPSSFDGDVGFYEESRWQKLRRKLIEEPLIPLGCALTCWALYEATKSMRSGDKHRTNRMFRRRIYAQGFTIIAMVAGSAYWENDRSKRKEFGELSEEKRKREKRDAWIRELEVRDEEEQELRRVRDRLVLGGGAERKGVSEEEARRLEKGGAGTGSIRSAVEAGEGRGLQGPILTAVRHLWEGRG